MLENLNVNTYEVSLPSRCGAILEPKRTRGGAASTSIMGKSGLVKKLRWSTNVGGLPHVRLNLGANEHKKPWLRLNEGHSNNFAVSDNTCLRQPLAGTGRSVSKVSSLSLSSTF
jgi:hypothetical protein